MNDDLGTVVLVAGAVGEPGQRTFFLQAHGPAEPVTIKCEKQQVAALADYLERLIANVPESGPTAATPAFLTELVGPLDPRFVLGNIGLGWDDDAERIVLMLEELVADEEDTEDDDVPHDTVRLHLTPTVAATFCRRARELVAAGRPTCRWCGNPIDPDGHPCPRMN
jgi:uncharacterized repeat protein (TIGR03847 family)